MQYKLQSVFEYVYIVYMYTTGTKSSSSRAYMYGSPGYPLIIWLRPCMNTALYVPVMYQCSVITKSREQNYPDIYAYEGGRKNR